MVTKSKVIQGHTTSIDKSVNRWAEDNNVVIKNVTVSPFTTGSYGRAGWVTATVIFEVPDDHPIALEAAKRRQKVLDGQKQIEEMSSSQLGGICLAFVLIFCFLGWLMFKAVTG